jgi:hypothetical protein
VPPKAIETLADISVEMAHIFLEGLRPYDADADPVPIWEMDRKSVMAETGTEEPISWINLLVSTYMGEAANELVAIASLLRAETVIASLDPLVRALIERIGWVNWILDHETDAMHRAGRAGIGYIVSLQHYRETLARLNADDVVRALAMAERKRIEETFLNGFDVERPLSDSNAQKPKPTKDATEWVTQGDPFPTFTAVAHSAMSAGGVDGATAAGSYDILAGFSHPSVVFAQEHRTVDAEGSVIHHYRVHDVNKVVRLAVLVFADGVLHWIGYYLNNDPAIRARLDQTAARLDAIPGIDPPQ